MERFLVSPLFCSVYGWVIIWEKRRGGGIRGGREGPPRVKKKFSSSSPAAATAAAASFPEKKRQKGRNKLLAFQIRESCCSFPSRVCSMGARLCLINIFKRRWKAAAVKKRGRHTHAAFPPLLYFISLRFRIGKEFDRESNLMLLTPFLTSWICGMVVRYNFLKVAGR